MDFRPKAFNILGTLSRREEGYHRKLLESLYASSNSGQGEPKTRTIHEIYEAKEKGLDRCLIFDKYRKTSFLDHFIAEGTDFDSFRRGGYQEESDSVQAHYETHIREHDGNYTVVFSLSGNESEEGKGCPFGPEKRFTLSRGSVKAYYQVVSRCRGKRKTYFGIEFNINLLAGDAPDRYYRIPGHDLEDRKLASAGECKEVSEIELIDEWMRLRVFLKILPACTLWRFPIETVSLSESGFERVFQGSCLLAGWPLELEPERGFETSIELGVESF